MSPSPAMMIFNSPYVIKGVKYLTVVKYILIPHATYEIIF